MRTVIGILLFTFLFLLDFIESAGPSPNVMNEILSRLREMTPCSDGIYWILVPNGQFLPIDRGFLQLHKVEYQDFIIGVSVNDFLCPMYDFERNMVIVRKRGFKNIQLSMNERDKMQYFRVMPNTNSNQGKHAGLSVQEAVPPHHQN